MSFRTTSPVGYELIKSEKNFSSLYSQLLEPDIWQVMKKSSWDEQKVAYTNVKSMDFPALLGPLETRESYTAEMDDQCSGGGLIPSINKRNLEMTLLLAAALSSVISTPNRTWACSMGA